jgi:tryptophanyl-tRNA synthetase
LAKPVVFSGIQPSGNLHIGNYLGAIARWVPLQGQRNSIFCIVDLHAITLYQEPKALHAQIRELAGLYLACGLDPKRTIVFVQSHVPAHAELSWMLNCITPMGWLRRMTQFKEKSAKAKEEVCAGLFDYPVLMAADILLYDANLVPVGDDQRQHVELTRDVAIRFNNIYGETFVIPEAEIAQTGARVMSLSDPTSKMSKSESGAGTLALLDSNDALRTKVMRAKTDALRGIVFDPAREGLFNLLSIYQLLSKQTPAEIEAHFEGKGYADLKRELVDLIVATLTPIRGEYERIRADGGYLESVLHDGACRAETIASVILARVKERMGLG